MKPLLRPLLLALSLCACAAALPTAAAAQAGGEAAASADTLYQIRLSDGSVIYGRIVAQTESAVTVETQAGASVRLERAQVVSMRPVRGRVVGGRVWPEDPNHTRLFFGPTGRAVGAGRGYLGVYEIFFPFVTYGVTSNFSISGGTPIIPGVVGELWYFAPKLTFVETERMAVAAGALIGAAEGETAGIAYAAGTFGTPDQALTAGLGWGIGGGQVSNAILMLGGEMRLGPSTKLISENYLIPEVGSPVVSGGIRLFGERLSADLGIATVPFEDCEDFCWFPLVNFVYSF